jgi:hypothetical protein
MQTPWNFYHTLRATTTKDNQAFRNAVETVQRTTSGFGAPHLYFIRLALLHNPVRGRV